MNPDRIPRQHGSDQIILPRPHPQHPGHATHSQSPVMMRCPTPAASAANPSGNGFPVVTSIYSNNIPPRVLPAGLIMHQGQLGHQQQAMVAPANSLRQTYMQAPVMPNNQNGNQNLQYVVRGAQEPPRQLVFVHGAPGGYSGVSANTVQSAPVQLVNFPTGQPTATVTTMGTPIGTVNPPTIAVGPFGTLRRSPEQDLPMLSHNAAASRQFHDSTSLQAQINVGGSNGMCYMELPDVYPPEGLGFNETVTSIIEIANALEPDQRKELNQQLNKIVENEVRPARVIKTELPDPDDSVYVPPNLSSDDEDDAADNDVIPGCDARTGTTSPSAGTTVPLPDMGGSMIACTKCSKMFDICHIWGHYEVHFKDPPPFRCPFIHCRHKTYKDIGFFLKHLKLCMEKAVVLRPSSSSRNSVNSNIAVYQPPVAGRNSVSGDCAVSSRHLTGEPPVSEPGTRTNNNVVIIGPMMNDGVELKYNPHTAGAFVDVTAKNDDVTRRKRGRPYRKKSKRSKRTSSGHHSSGTPTVKLGLKMARKSMKQRPMVFETIIISSDEEG